MSPLVALLFAACSARAAASATGLSKALSQGQLARQHALEASWDKELEADGVSPVKRVVGLLKKMKAELEAETAKESEMYDKMVCWCETNEKEKTAAIAAAEAKDKDLSAEIEGRAASFGEFSAEIERLKKEVAENTQALKEATAIREKEASEFRAHEVDLVQTVTNLRNAIAVLAKHQTSLLQVEGTELVGLRVVLKSLTLKYEELLASREERQHTGRLGAVSGLQISKQGFQGDALAALHSWGGAHAGEVLPIEIAERMLAKAARGPQRPADKAAFLQADRQPIYQSRSAARSSEIFGILNQMLDEFNKELTTSQAAELKSSEDYAALAAAKQEQIDTGKKKLDELEAAHAANEKALSDAKEDLANTRAQREADVEFLRNLQLQCNDLDSQWEKRSKTRAAELVAVSDTIAILTTDDNRELLSKSVTLLQVAASSSKRAKTVALLRSMARSPDFEANDLLEAWRGRGAGGVAAPGPRAQLSTLAMAAQLDGFEKVKELMDKMVADLKAQMTEEVALKDHCTKEFDQNNKTVYEKTELKKDLETKIAQLAALVERLNGEIAAAKAQIAATQEEVKKASQIREQENGQFQAVVTDQRATQTILNKALQRLKDFYQKGLGKAVLAQRGVQEPPVKFNAYKDNAGSKSVIGLIEQIIEDSKKLEADATSAEAAAQADYETFVKDSNALIKNLEDGITANTKAIAAAKEDDAEANSDLTSTIGELESLTAYEADLHSQCDFVLRNFDIRQKARLQEIEAIQAAKAILSGAK